jgi:hypothetical protein
MRVVRPTRHLVASLLLLSAWGWLELLRAVRVPGPRLVDALPLYEGSRHDALPAITFVAVWIAVATLACLPFRPRFPQACATLLGVAVFAVSLAIQGAQLELARQSSPGIDLAAALRTSSPWLAGGLCSLVAVLAWCRPRATSTIDPEPDEAR